MAESRNQSSRQPAWAREMEHRIERMILVASQADIDAVTSKLSDLKTALTADDAAIQTEIANLQAANPNLDLSGLQSAVSDLSSQVDATSALVPPADTTGGGTPAPSA